MKKEALLKAIREPLRLLVLAVIPFALSYFSVINTQWAVIIVAILRFIDKYVHLLGKESGDENLVKGITRF